MNMRGVIAVLAAFAALATTLVAGAGAAGTSVPSGGNLVFAAIDPRDGMSDIYVQPTGGSAPLNITDSAGPRKDLSPVFAPSGSKIAFVRANAQGASIMVVNPNGTGLVNVTPLQLRGAINTDPSWSADGTRIVFSSNVDGNYDLYWIDASDGIDPAVAAAPSDEDGGAGAEPGSVVVSDRQARRLLEDRASDLAQQLGDHQLG